MYKKIAEKGHGVMPCPKRDWLHLSLPTIKFATVISLFLTRTASSTAIPAHPTTFFYSLSCSKQ